jgi:hypothetical protein
MILPIPGSGGALVKPYDRVIWLQPQEIARVKVWFQARNKRSSGQGFRTINGCPSFQAQFLQNLIPHFLLNFLYFG